MLPSCGSHGFRRYVEQSVPLAGREFALWVIKDLRRAGTGGGRTEALNARASHPGLEAFVERLAKARPEDLETLEKEIRGGK